MADSFPLTEKTRFLDIVNRPLRTPLIRAAGKAGARTFNGRGMLLYQGALAFRLWTGKSAPVDVMKRALRSAPTQRS
jgi:shikimate dehydrogenase